MSARFYIVAPCTNRKQLPPPPELCLRSVRERELNVRVRAWTGRLEHHASSTCLAGEMYAGDHWSVVRTLSRIVEAGGFEPETWIISAGYGLVSTKAALHAYSATFAAGHADSISAGAARSRTDAVNQAWWGSLSEWSGPQPRAPRSLEALAQRDPNARMLIFGSPSYVRAVEKDLLAAIDRLEVPERLVLVSTRDVEGSRLARHLVVGDARVQSEFGGARVSLHARVARHLLKVALDCEWHVSRLRLRYQEVLRAVPEANMDQRKKMTDTEIHQFIVEQLARDPRATATRLLRALREGGSACEQARFKTLFVETRKRVHGA